MHFSVRTLGENLEKAVEVEKAEKGPSFDESFSDMISVRRSNTDTLFYRLLEKIAVAERQRLSQNEYMDLGVRF